MNLPKISFSRPSFSSPRFFIYLLFGFVILVLLTEGGYYFWIQKRTERQQAKSPVIAREEDIFTYVNSPDGTIQKMILGRIKEIDGNLLTIKTDNNKIIQVVFVGENAFIGRSGPELEAGELKTGTMTDLSIGDEVRIGEIYSEEGQITIKHLVIIKRY